MYTKLWTNHRYLSALIKHFVELRTSSFCVCVSLLYFELNASDVCVCSKQIFHFLRIAFCIGFGVYVCLCLRWLVSEEIYEFSSGIRSLTKSLLRIVDSFKSVFFNWKKKNLNLFRVVCVICSFYFDVKIIRPLWKKINRNEFKTILAWLKLF